MRIIFGLGFFLLIAGLWGCSAKMRTVSSSRKPLMIAEQGYFFVASKWLSENVR
jgi:hypothetical protein